MSLLKYHQNIIKVVERKIIMKIKEVIKDLEHRINIVGVNQRKIKKKN